MEQTRTANSVLFSICPPDCRTTLAGVLRSLLVRPGDLLIRRWNWKASLLSSLIRGLLFLGVNLTAGWRAAAAAGSAEFLYRAITAGFYGALTQSFRGVDPKWQGTLAVIVLLPILTHAFEFVLHWWRGTPNLAASIAASTCLTLLSTTFNLYAMRRGTLVVGDEGKSLVSDLRALPRLISGYVLAGPIAVRRFLSRRYLHSNSSL